MYVFMFYLEFEFFLVLEHAQLNISETSTHVLKHAESPPFFVSEPCEGILSKFVEPRFISREEEQLFI